MIVVALVLIVPAGLVRSGAVNLATRTLVDTSRPAGQHIALMGGIGGVLPAFMDSVAALALLMQVDIQTAQKAGRLSLMPLSFAIIMGGMVTLIGTPPDIIVASIRQERPGEGFAMFDFAPVGGITVLAGLLFVATVGWRPVPVPKGDKGVEAVVPEGARIAGRAVASIGLAWRRRAVLLGISRRGRRIGGQVRRTKVRPGDVLLLLVPAEREQDLTDWLGVLPLPDRGLAVTDYRKIRLAIGLFGGAVAAASLGLVYLPVAPGIVVAAYVAARILPVRELYDFVERPVIVLLGSMIPLGAALEGFGGTELIAGWLTAATADLPVWAVLTVPVLVTMALLDVSSRRRSGTRWRSRSACRPARS